MWEIVPDQMIKGKTFKNGKVNVHMGRERVFSEKNPPSLPSSFLVWERCQVSPKKISKSGHWGILRKRTFCT